MSNSEGRGETYGKLWRTIAGIARREKVNSQPAGDLFWRKRGRHLQNRKRQTGRSQTCHHQKTGGSLKIPYEGLMYKAGYIEEVHEDRAPYETKCKSLEKAEAYDLKNLALLENEKWQYLNKEDLLMLDHYFRLYQTKPKTVC